MNDVTQKNIYRNLETQNDKVMTYTGIFHAKSDCTKFKA